MAVYTFPSQGTNIPDAQRRRVGIRGDFINPDLKDDTPSLHLTDTERATAQPIIEAKVEEFAALLPPKAKALIVTAALQNPQLAQQMRTGGISFSSSIVQNAVKAAMADVQSGKITEANIHGPRTNSNGPDAEGGHHGSRHGALTALEAIRRAALRESSAKYDGMGGERLSSSDLQNMASARAAAISYGMPWALNNPDLLKLGPAAIKTLHDAGVKKERFERMTGDKVGFRASTAVAIAAYAKKHNLTPEQTNELYDKINKGVEVLSGGDKAIQRELDEATRKFITNPQAPDAKQKLDEAYLKHADTPEKKKAAEATTKALEEASQRQSADVAVRNADVTARDAVVDAARAKELEFEARMAALEGGAAPGTGTSGVIKRADADTVNPAEQQPPAATAPVDKKGTTQQADAKPTGTTQVAAAKPTAPAGPKV